jgi:hydrogenase maturation factor
VLGESVRPGDCVLLTKGIAIEGTALLARERASLLAERGVTAETIAGASAMLFDPGISVVADARAICSAARPHAMHDPTEGGLATALEELAQASGATLRVDQAPVPVFDETRAVCDALGLDPMGLLASGALLAVVGSGDCDATIARLAEAQIACQVIATVEAGPARVIMGPKESAAPITRFARDELARFFEESQG